MLESTDDDAFESVVASCREARIQDSKAVRARIIQIELPRTVLSELNNCINNDRLDVNALQKALTRGAECEGSAGSKGTELRASMESAHKLLVGLKSLEQVFAHGRRAQAQLLASVSEHDTTHIDRCKRALEEFEDMCSVNRSSLDEPRNLTVFRETIDKWEREEGPSRLLKAALQGSDGEKLKQAIQVAKAAGIGVKAAKKRLGLLEQNAKNKVELEAALVSGDTARLKRAVTEARSLGMEVGEAKEVLRRLVQRDVCKEQLEIACKAGREERLAQAIANARERGIDCTKEEEILDGIITK